MSFGPPRDLLLTSSEHPSTLSNLEKPKFSSYKFNLPCGSLLQMKPPINSFWSHELLASANTEKSLHIILKFTMNVEEKSYDDDMSNFFISSSSSSSSDSVSDCSTISPETAKVIRRQSHWKWQADDWSTVLSSSRQCTPRTPRTSDETENTRKMSLDRAQSRPLQIQSSSTSSRSSKVEHGFSIRHQLSHKSQPYTNGTNESCSQTKNDDSVDSMPA